MRLGNHLFQLDDGHGHSVNDLIAFGNSRHLGHNSSSLLHNNKSLLHHSDSHGHPHGIHLFMLNWEYVQFPLMLTAVICVLGIFKVRSRGHGSSVKESSQRGILLVRNWDTNKMSSFCKKIVWTVEIWWIFSEEQWLELSRLGQYNEIVGFCVRNL